MSREAVTKKEIFIFLQFFPIIINRFLRKKKKFYIELGHSWKFRLMYRLHIREFISANILTEDRDIRIIRISEPEPSDPYYPDIRI